MNILVIEDEKKVALALMLPGRDGLEILKTLRKTSMGTPVLILTAKDA